ncbi:ribonuclease [Comamonas humi]
MLKALASHGYRSVVAGVLGMVLLGASLPGEARDSRYETATPAVPDAVGLADLPEQGRTTYALILEGGPFPYDKDGSVFGNRERILPPHKRGYYREYTVKTPRARNRGARRIICGGQVPTQPDACYYTNDHYASFRVIVK